VTHWDRENNSKNKTEYETAKKILMESNDIVDSFIFIGKGSNPKSACKAIYQSLCISPPT